MDLLLDDIVEIEYYTDKIIIEINLDEFITITGNKCKSNQDIKKGIERHVKGIVNILIDND